MANALSAGKTKTPRDAVSASTRSAAGLKDQRAATASVANLSASQRSASSPAKLRVGSELLTKAARTFPAVGSGQHAASGVEEFRQAYLTIAQSIPKNHRLALLKTMRTSIDELVQAEQGGLDAASGKKASGGISTTDYMAELSHQEETRRATDIQTGRLVSGAQLRQKLQISAQALSAALKKTRIFAVLGPSGEYLYPAFFADQKFDRRALERVSQTLGQLPGASKWDFFTTARLSLGGKTVLQALEKGKVDAVLDAANAFRDE